MSDIKNLLEQCLRRNLPDCEALISVERLTGGASLETYRIEIKTSAGSKPLAVRRAQQGKSRQYESISTKTLPGLVMEAKLMRVAKAAGVPEPEVIYVMAPEDGLGEGFIMEWIEGISLGQQVLKAPELDNIRPRLAYLCGEALANIHAIDIDASGLRSDLYVQDTETLIKQTLKKYRSYDTAQPMLDYTGRWLLENMPQDVTQTLVHNDYRNGNMIFSPEGIVAVLDWEFTNIGDPMRDLGWMCMNSWRFGRSELQAGGLGTYEDFFAGYESVSGNPVNLKHVQFWEVFGSLSWAAGCLEMGYYYRIGADTSIERPGIGRRCSEALVDCVNLLIPGPVDLVQPPSVQDDNLPNIDELLASVVDYLRGDVLEKTKGRTKFHARVASNSLGIVRRECELGETARSLELTRLQGLFDCENDLTTLRGRLSSELRDGSMPLDAPSLTEHLRHTAVNQLAIDQPKYSGLTNALANNQLT